MADSRAAHEPFPCPRCGQGIIEVRVYSEAYQLGTLDGNTIVRYGEIEDITDPVAIECPLCDGDLTRDIEL